MSIYRKPIAVLLVPFLIFLTYYVLDTKITLLVSKLWRSNPRFAVFSSTIPDFLFPIVCIITVIAWATYFYLSRKGIYNIHTRFFQLVAITIPLSFFLKTVLKYGFGRINPRYWLRHTNFDEWRWFHGVGYYSSFPSGHMAVFTVLVLALWKYYPRYRSAYFAFLFLLSSALILTNYHYLSDIIAGFYLGFLIDYFSNRGIAFFDRKKAR